MLTVGLLDQTSSTLRTAVRLRWRPSYRSDEDLVEAVEERLPSKAMVFQLPYRPVPGGPRTSFRMADYDLLRGYLHSHDLRWSYGVIRRGAGDDRNIPISTEKVPELMVRDLKASGFAGIYVDRFGYTDGATAAR